MKVFQVIYGDMPEKIEHCVESVKIFYPKVEVFKFDKIEGPVHDSDIFRIDMLGKYDDILYIDWDILIKNQLEFDNNNVNCNYLKGTPDYSIIYSPKKEFWISFENERMRRGISKNTYGWPRKILRNMETVELKDGFLHLRYTSS